MEILRAECLALITEYSSIRDLLLIAFSIRRYKTEHILQFCPLSFERRYLDFTEHNLAFHH